MIRGEHRPIEEEIANRILSDISEEGSLAGSVASLEELEPYFAIRDYRYQPRHLQQDRSGSSTPRLDENLSDEEDLSSSPTLSPKTVKESENFTPAGPLSPPAALSPGVSEKEEPQKVQEPEEQEYERAASKSSTPSTLKEAVPEPVKVKKDEPLVIPIEKIEKVEEKPEKPVEIPQKPQSVEPQIVESKEKPTKREENNNIRMETTIAHVHVPDKVPVEELRKMENEVNGREKRRFR